MIDFSIVIPTYNRAGLIADAIDSVLKQTYQSFEIIVIDDGSTDDTATVLKSKYASESKLTYIYQENAERGASRNHGIAQAKGDYIVFLDSDDLLAATHLQVLKATIDRYPKCNFFATKYSFFFPEKPNIKQPSDLSKYAEGFYKIEIVLKGNPLACNFCVKTKSSFALFSEERRLSAMEDWVFLVTNLFNEPIYLIDEETVFMREHEQRSMRAEHANIIKKRLDALSYLLETVSLSSQQEQQLKAYSYYFCAIHAFEGEDISLAKEMINKAASLIGWNRELILMRVKIMFGYKMIATIKSIIR